MREEVDLAAPGVGGQNYGWRCYEGTIPTPTVDPPCEPAGHVPPLFDLDQEADGVCSIIGGYVSRDAGLPSLAGRYLYGDLCRPEIQSAAANGEPGTATGMAVEGSCPSGRTPAAGSTPSPSTARSRGSATAPARPATCPSRPRLPPARGRGARRREPARRYRADRPRRACACAAAPVSGFAAVARSG